MAIGPCRRTTCRNWAKKNAPLKVDANKRNPAVLPAEKAREVKKRIGISGASARNSQPTNATSAIAPPANAATTSALAQPDSFPRIKPHTSPNAAALTNPIPT